MNWRTHVVLKNLRLGPDGKVDPTKRGIPTGWGFDTVHCANYLWEILGWTTYSIMTKSYMSALFTLFGLGIMYAWAQKKKGKLIQYFSNDEKLVRRFKKKPALIPFFK